MNGLGFTSEAQVRDFLQECPKRDAFEVFLDVVLFFCCDLV